MPVVYFNNMFELEKYKIENQNKSSNNSISEPLTKKEIKQIEAKESYDIKEFFISIKNDFIEGKKKRKDIIKDLKSFIEEKYKNKDLAF